METYSKTSKDLQIPVATGHPV